MYVKVLKVLVVIRFHYVIVNSVISEVRCLHCLEVGTILT